MIFKGERMTEVSSFGITHIKKYSEYTLMNMRKDELIRYIRLLESNYEGLNLQYENAVGANLEKFADFEKVIRCKDCKYNNGGRCSWHNSLNYSWVVDDEDYCSCGEKKE